MEADGQGYIPVGRRGKQSICKLSEGDRVKGKRFSCTHKEFSDKSGTQAQPCRGFLTQTRRGIALIVSLYSIYHLVHLYNCMLCFVSTAMSCSTYAVSILCLSVAGVGNTKWNNCSCFLILVYVRVKSSLRKTYHYPNQKTKSSATFQTLQHCRTQ